MGFRVHRPIVVRQAFSDLGLLIVRIVPIKLPLLGLLQLVIDACLFDRCLRRRDIRCRLLFFAAVGDHLHEQLRVVPHEIANLRPVGRAGGREWYHLRLGVGVLLYRLRMRLNRSHLVIRLDLANKLEVVDFLRSVIGSLHSGEVLDFFHDEVEPFLVDQPIVQCIAFQKQEVYIDVLE